MAQAATKLPVPSKKDISTDLCMNVPHAWAIIRDVRQRVSDLLSEHDQEVIDAVIMTASELTENAVKYGCPVPAQPSVRFTAHVTQLEASVSVSNGVHPDTSVDVVLKTIQQLDETDDPAELYMERLREMLMDPGGAGSHLGLLRIAYEGLFELSCSFDAPNNVLTISATRKF